MEIRTDSGDDAWGFVWYAGSAICQRCQSVVEFLPNGQAEQEEMEEVEEEEEQAE
jgi:hypothetical protein